MEGSGPLCLTCAELDHLVFLGRGDAALTRRAKVEMLMSGMQRSEAREAVRGDVDRVLAGWRARK